MALNVQNAKIELIQWLTTVDDIAMLKKLLEFRNSSTYELSETERLSIDQGLEDLKNGEVIPHSETKKVYEKWL
jgi:hypothetical protein